MDELALAIAQGETPIVLQRTAGQQQGLVDLLRIERFDRMDVDPGQLGHG